MKVRTFKAPTIREAMREARMALGDDVLLLESVAPEHEDDLARITVMIDEPMANQRTSKSANQNSNVASSGRRYGYRAYAQSKQKTEEPASVAAQVSEQYDDQELVENDYNQKAVVSQRNYSPPMAANQSQSGQGQTAQSQAVQNLPNKKPSVRNRRNDENNISQGQDNGNGVVRGRLFPASDQQNSPVQPPVDQTANKVKDILDAQFQVLHRRLNTLETRMGNAVVGASNRWMANPLYGDLLKQGLRPVTTAKLFDKVAKEGHRPEETSEELTWSVAKHLRQMLDIPSPKGNTGTLVFIGPAGVGKTTLILKLAANPGFYGRRATAVISILPEENDEALYHNPASLYQQFGVPLQTVRNEAEMSQALDRVSHFDQVLIDTPPISLRGATAHRALWRIKRMIEPIVPAEVHLVMNTTRAIEDLDVELINGLPLSPDKVALTHLDETHSWGRAAEWVVSLGRPVRFASTDRRVPDGVVPFSPGWFVEEMIDL